MTKDKTSMCMDFNIDSGWCLEQLQHDGLITQRDHDLIRTTPRRINQQAWHALQWIAHFKIRHRQDQTILTLANLCMWLAKKSNLLLYELDPLQLDITALTQVMSQEFAFKNNILAVKVNHDEVWIATTQPFNQQWLPQVTMSQKKKRIITVLLNPHLMQRYQVELYSVKQATVSVDQYQDTNTWAETLPNSMDTELDEPHIIHLVDWLLKFAFEQRASDIHLEPQQLQARVRFRIDGILHCVYQMPMTSYTAVVARLKILAQLNVAERRRPQDGRIRIQGVQQERELRLSTLATAFGEKIVLRIFDPALLFRELSQLGFDAELLTVWQKLIQSRHGMILVTGPTGSGKTTTLYSSLKCCATTQVNVCSIEDPIEVIEPSFNQLQVNPTINLDFAEAIRALMRQDPDIIMVGEIRDQQTAQMAIQAALTGHLVFSTLHTQNAVSSVMRLQDLGVATFLISATLLGVLAQRLVRKLCVHCKQYGEVDPSQWQSLIMNEEYPQPLQLFQPRGCVHCRQTGFLGRIALYEFMPVNNDVKQQMMKSKDIDGLRKAAANAGMLSLRIAAIKQVLSGAIGLEEALTVLVSEKE